MREVLIVLILAGMGVAHAQEPAFGVEREEEGEKGRKGERESEHSALSTQHSALSTPAADLQPPASSLQPTAWVSGEYLLWWLRDDQVPGPLVTTGSLGDPRPGALGMAGTSVLVSQSELDYRSKSGVRLTLGRWLDPEQVFAVEAVGFLLETHTIHGEANSDRAGAPVIARPFFNVMTGQEDAQVLTAPGRSLGGIDVFADSRLWGAEANLSGNLIQSETGRWDLLTGFRYLGLKDELRFSQSSTLLAPNQMGFLGVPVPPPNIVSLRDFFETHNQFYGGQVGVRTEWARGRWTLGATAEVGLGATQQALRITGHTLDTDSTGFTRRASGGLYSQNSNIGWNERYRLTFVSETDVRLGCRITPRLSAHLGYTFLYWGEVVRPGAALNRAVDPRQVPSSLSFGTPAAPPQPIRLFPSTDFWAQGLFCGLMLNF